MRAAIAGLCQYHRQRRRLMFRTSDSMVRYDEWTFPNLFLLSYVRTCSEHELRRKPKYSRKLAAVMRCDRIRHCR